MCEEKELHNKIIQNFIHTDPLSLSVIHVILNQQTHLQEYNTGLYIQGQQGQLLCLLTVQGLVQAISPQHRGQELNSHVNIRKWQEYVFYIYTIW